MPVRRPPALAAHTGGAEDAETDAVFIRKYLSGAGNEVLAEFTTVATEAGTRHRPLLLLLYLYFYYSGH
jgi:hypothetical protein